MRHASGSLPSLGRRRGTAETSGRSARKANEDKLDRKITEWTAGLPLGFRPATIGQQHRRYPRAVY
jgi:hypothetical protein